MKIAIIGDCGAGKTALTHAIETSSRCNEIEIVSLEEARENGAVMVNDLPTKPPEVYFPITAREFLPYPRDIKCGKQLRRERRKKNRKKIVQNRKL
jgi:ABC-type Mn2+/Zn2+ transport system ATPase subunit